MSDKIEEIILPDGEELEEIKRSGFVDRFPFPAVTIHGTTIYFNRFCTSLLGQVVRWYMTGDYVIGLPPQKGDATVDVFAIRFHGPGKGARTTFPMAMRSGKRVREGAYKVYKYKDGLAFKRHEPLEEVQE